ncbi:MAG: hypothetical protein ACFFD2_29010 [Promethearchaeota archaeon]
MIATFAFVLNLPLFWLPNNTMGELIARITQDTGLILLFLMFPFLIMAFEGMKKQFFSPITILYIASTTYCLGFLTTIPPRWDYVFSPNLNMWFQNTKLEVDLLFTFFALAAVIIIMFRLIQFITGKETGRSRKMPIIALAGFLGAIVAGVSLFIFGVENVDYLSIAIGTFIVTSIYIRYPESFFLSNTKISAIMFINNNSKVPYLILGKSGSTDVHLTAAGLGGVMELLQEILEVENPPTRLFHGDKGFLLEHNIKYETTGVIVADQINTLLLRPLKYALSLFIEKYETELTNWAGEVSCFQDFKKEIRTIFKFALSKKELSQEHPGF